MVIAVLDMRIPGKRYVHANCKLVKISAILNRHMRHGNVEYLGIISLCTTPSKLAP